MRKFSYMYFSFAVKSQTQATEHLRNKHTNEQMLQIAKIERSRVFKLIGSRPAGFSQSGANKLKSGLPRAQ